MRATLEAITEPRPDESDPVELIGARDELNRITALLHTRVPGVGDTPYQVMSAIVGFMGRGDVPDPSIPQHGIEQLDQERRDAVAQAVGEYIRALELTGNVDEHPFRGAREIGLQPVDQNRLKKELDTAADGIDAFMKHASETARSWELPEPATFDETNTLCERLNMLSGVPDCDEGVITKLCAATDFDGLCDALGKGAAWLEKHTESKDDFTAAAWDADVKALRPHIVKGQVSRISRVVGKYKRCCDELEPLYRGDFPKDPKERLAILDRIIEVQHLRGRLADEEVWPEIDTENRMARRGALPLPDCLMWQSGWYR